MRRGSCEGNERHGDGGDGGAATGRARTRRAPTRSRTAPPGAPRSTRCGAPTSSSGASRDRVSRLLPHRGTGNSTTPTTTPRCDAGRISVPAFTDCRPQHLASRRNPRDGQRFGPAGDGRLGVAEPPVTERRSARTTPLRRRWSLASGRKVWVMLHTVGESLDGDWEWRKCSCGWSGRLPLAGWHSADARGRVLKRLVVEHLGRA